MNKSVFFILILLISFTTFVSALNVDIPVKTSSSTTIINNTNVTNIYQNVSNITNFINNLTGDVLVIKSNGTRIFYQAASNTDSARGIAFLNAVGNGSLGDNIYLNSNIYNVGNNKIDLTVGISIHGTGNSRIISSYNEQTSMALGSNTIIEGIIYTSSGYGIGNADGVDNQVNNVTIRNSKLYGSADVIFMTTYGSDLNIENCDMYSAIDVVSVNYGINVYVYNSRYNVLNNGSLSRVAGIFADSGNIYDYNGIINVISLTSTPAYGLYGNSIGRIYSYGTIINTLSLGNAYDTYNDGTSFIYISPFTLYNSSKTFGSYINLIGGNTSFQNLFANNICYANGTNCISTNLSTYWNDTNTPPKNVTFNSLNIGYGNPIAYYDYPNSATFTTTYFPLQPLGVSGYANGYSLYFQDDGGGLLIDQATLLAMGTVNYATGVVDTTGYASDVVDELDYNYYPVGFAINGSGIMTSNFEQVGTASGYDYASGQFKLRSANTKSKIWYNLGSADFLYLDMQGSQLWKNGWNYTSFSRVSNPYFGGDNTHSNLISISKQGTNEGAWIYRLKGTNGVNFFDPIQIYADGVVIGSAFDTPYGQPEAPFVFLNSRFSTSRPNAIVKKFNSGQTMDLWQWQDFNNATFGKVNASGWLMFNNSFFGNSTNNVTINSNGINGNINANLSNITTTGTTTSNGLITGNAGATINGGDVTVNSNYNIKSSDNSFTLSSYYGLLMGSDKSIGWKDNTNVFSGTQDVFLKRTNTSTLTLSSDGASGLANLNVTGNFTGNQIYGEMWFDNDSKQTVTISSTNTWYNISFNETTDRGQTLNGISYGNNSLICLDNGLYDAKYSVSMESDGVNKEYNVALSNGTDYYHNTETHTQFSLNANPLTVSDGGFIRCSTNMRIYLQARQVTTVASNLGIHQAHLNLVRIGN